MRIRRLNSSVRAIALALLFLAPVAAQPSRRIIYGGDARFPPYEYLDSEGRPRGFNIQLLQAIAREAGFSVEVRLADWQTRKAALDSGKVDVISLARSDERDHGQVKNRIPITLAQVRRGQDHEPFGHHMKQGSERA